MKRNVLHTIACGLGGLLLALPSAAQNTSKFTFDIGGGFTEPVQHTPNRLDTGFNFNVGGGFNFTPHLGVIGEFGYNELGVTNAVLQRVGVPNGTGRIYSVTLNPIVHFNPRGRFDAYIVGGGGYYRRTIEFTEPSVITVTAFDPFFGVFFPANIPANTVLGSFTQNKGGLNVGAGVSLRVRGDSNAKFYAESRYHYIFTTPVGTSILPVTFGLRW
jgi:opacity protein-like surface antigen